MNKIELNSEQIIAYKKQRSLVEQLDADSDKISSELLLIGQEYTKRLCEAKKINNKIKNIRIDIIFAKNCYASYFMIKEDGKKKDTLDNTDSKIQNSYELLEKVKVMCADSSKEYIKIRSDEAKNIMKMCSTVRLLIEQEIEFLKEARAFAIKRRELKHSKNSIKRRIWALRLEFKKSLE
jgi:hypothetical protein